MTRAARPARDATTFDRDWHVGEDGIGYPPEPWYLGGTLRTSVFIVPAAQVPAEVASAPEAAGARPLRLAGNLVIGASFVEYSEGGVLAYDELLIAVAGRRGLAPRVSIPHIWVDSPQSRTGGRELWAIPKDLATFDVTPTAAHRTHSSAPVTRTMSLDGTVVASLTSTDGRRILPGMPHLPLTLAQHLDGRTVISHNNLFTQLRTLRAEWTFDADGPLGYLAGRAPVLSVALADSSIVFGSAVLR